MFYLFINSFLFSLQDEIGLKEWANSLRSAYKCSLELLKNMKKVNKIIYGGSRSDKISTIITPQNTNGH